MVDENGFYKTFDEIHFRNGYAKDARSMMVNCGCIFTGYRELDGKEQNVFVIELGEVMNDEVL